ncbi:cytochrome P450 [Amycolatopsis sp. NBC_00345]|uniref:cytochrome P450 n=1 Tax=Amycolatopsis sp. NBC_00345 TaxID=2975955 RepID=UPI002E25DE45
MPESELVDSTTQVTFPPKRYRFGGQAEYERLREQGIISKVPTVDGGETWWATDRADVKAILADRRFSSDRSNPGFPLMLRDPEVRRQNRNQPPMMISMDGAEHAEARRAVLGEFTVKRLAGLRPRVQEIVDGFVDAMLATEERSADLVQALSLPVPSLVICEVLGVPYADHDFFQERSAKVLSRTISAAERQVAVDELRGYLDGLVTAKEAEPGDDLLSRQIEKQRAEGEVDHEYMIGIAILLLIAGHETTANMISLSVVGLLNNPEQLAAIRADPAKIPMAVEESLRYFSIADPIPRVATEDVEIGGVTIKAGEGVIASGYAANFDPGAFPDPAELDVGRGTRSHVAFGYGPHQCLGQNLARQELEIVFGTLFRRIPDLKLATPVEDISFKVDGAVYGIHELPVSW